MLDQGRRRQAQGRKTGGLACLFPLLLPFSLCTAGCSNFWDEVTSRDFDVKNLYSKPNPLVVLKESTDGDKRAAALRSLHEPKQVGGSAAEQDLVVQVLTTAAANERQALCRLAAIHALGGFKDPRAVEALRNAYYNASSFPADTATVIRCQALTALGETGNPAAVELLARVVQEPPVEGAEEDRQQKLDERIAAARALGHFKHYQATGALVRVLRTEKDVALRDRAHESLEVATGKKLPPDARAWEQFLQSGNDTQLAGDGKKARGPEIQQTGGK